MRNKLTSLIPIDGFPIALDHFKHLRFCKMIGLEDAKVGQTQKDRIREDLIWEVHVLEDQVQED